MLCVRESDVVIRWGGEEFFILLYECDMQQAKNVAERIRETVQNMVSITVSIGVAIHEGNSWEESVNHADLALYRAKDRGRNTVVVYSNKEFQNNEIAETTN